MSLKSFIEGVFLSLAGIWWPKGETQTIATLPAETSNQDNERLNYIETKLHRIGHRLDEIEKRQEEIDRKLDAQILLSEEILSSLAALETQKANRKNAAALVDKAPEIKVVAQVHQQKSKKQILN